MEMRELQELSLERRGNFPFVRNQKIYTDALEEGLDESSAIKNVLQLMNLKPKDGSIFNEITKDRVVEIYFYDTYNPLFVNNKFFDVSTFRMEDLDGTDIFNLVERNKCIQEATLKAVQKTMEYPGKFIPEIPNTVLRQTIRDNIYFSVKYKYACGLLCGDVYPLGFINIMEASRLPDDNISLLWGN